MLQTRVLLKYWLPVVLWMALIFSASTGAMSAQHTSRIIGPLLRWLKPDISSEAIYRVQFVVRKIAHVTEFAVLAVLVWRACRKPAKGQRKPWRWAEAGVAFGVTVAYAVSDELHQALVPERQGCVSDVLLDSCGAALGLLLVWAIGRWRQSW